MSVFLCKENVRETLVSQGISLTTSHNTFLYIRYSGILKKMAARLSSHQVHYSKSVISLSFR